MAHKSQILLADAWARSSVTERKLEELVRDGLLRPRARRTQPEWRVLMSGHREPAPPEGYVVSFMAFHERGFGVLASPFMRALLHYYNMELHHLAPNSISQAAIFAVVCEGYLGMEPQWNCGSTSSGQSTLRRRQASEGCGVQCTQGAAPSKSGLVEATNTSRRS
jgi:hypothetical protein